MKIWRRACKIGSLMLLSAAIAACSGGRGGAEQSGNRSSSSPAGGISAPDNITAVTITVMTKDRFLAEAEQKFEAANPGIDIQISELVPADTSSGDKVIIKSGGDADSGPKPEDVEKYANTVNTALMSGKASDIISTEYLPVDEYVDKGLLADWNELAAQDSGFDKAGYYENVLYGVSQGDGWYGIPIDFSLDFLLGDASLVEQNGLNDDTWTWDQFIELLETAKAEGKFGIAMITPEKLLQNLAEAVYGQLVKRDGDKAVFDASLFQTYMENIKRLYDNDLATPDGIGPENASFQYHTLTGPMEAALLPRSDGSPQAWIKPPGTGKDAAKGIPFQSSRVLSLNAKSQVKEAAWSFVQFLLSEEMQSSTAMRSFSVNKAAAKAKLAETQEMLARSGSGDGADGPQISMRSKDGSVITPTFSDEDIEKVLGLLSTASQYSNRDPQVLSMIAEATTDYFSGSKSAAAVAGSLANRINTYLNE
ncbi:ABC transporter substrate-binding protein [Paenibacillus sp. M1]|uniref:ABC transporter substrate-binding protein n=1 Tax=Paenibacillus haidiansis TaxID=1574488 RepID=A0ABU7VRD5_9BACL